jgi:hypothetical protein
MALAIESVGADGKVKAKLVLADSTKNMQTGASYNKSLAAPLFHRAGLGYDAIDITPYPHTIRVDLNTGRLAQILVPSRRFRLWIDGLNSRPLRSRIGGLLVD